MKAVKLFSILLILIFSFKGTSYSHSTVNNQMGKDRVIVVIINRIDFQHLYAMDQVKHMIDHGFIALMNTRVSGRNNEYKAYATIGWGTRAEASKDTSVFYNIDKENIRVFQRRTGSLPPSKGVINTNINVLTRQNAIGEFRGIPGILGDTLRRNGLKAAVLGNSDTDEKNRSVAFIAMDKDGHIPLGGVGKEFIMEDNLRPFGIKTDYQKLLNEFYRIYNESSLIVIETGDISRLEAYKKHLSREMYQKYKFNIQNDINSFLIKLNNKIDFSDTVLMLISPYPSDTAAEQGGRLTPVVIYEGGKEAGLLTSDTTRRKGIIGNVDIGPTILSYLQIEATNMTGRKVMKVPYENNIDYIVNLNKRVVNTSTQRYRVLYTFAVYEMLASIAALSYIIFRNKINSKYQSLISLILIGTIIPPFVFLILPLLGFQTITMTYVYLATISFFMTINIFIFTKNKPLLTLWVVASIIVLGIAIDIVLGQNLIKQSIMGYDPIIGARYYGIGNEYAGILLGSSLVASTLLLEIDKRLKPLIPLIFIILIIIIGYPTLGANVGATITSIVTFIYATIKLYGKKVKPILWIGILASVIFFISLLAIVDIFIIERKTHLAQAILQIASEGPTAILHIITRKIAMNLRVMGVTIWSRVLLIAIVVLSIIFYKPVGVFHKITEKYPKLTIGWSSILLACVLGFLVNDSGVVTAAMAAIYLTTSILYLVINDL